MNDEQQSEGNPSLLPAAKRGSAAADGPFTPTPPPLSPYPHETKYVRLKTSHLERSNKGLAQLPRKRKIEILSA
jgi:hypothetical protein